MRNIGRSSDVLSVLMHSLFLIIIAMHIPMVYFICKEWILIIIDEILRRSYSSGHILRRSFLYSLESNDAEEAEEKHEAYHSLHPLIYYGVSIGVYVWIVAFSVLINNTIFILGKID